MRTPTIIGFPDAPMRPPMLTVELEDADIVEVTPVRSLTCRRLENSLRQLGAAGSAWAMAHRCASALFKELRARAVLIHLLGRSGDELRTVGVAGQRAGDLLGEAFLVKDDGFSRAVIEGCAPLHARFDGPTPVPVPARLAALAPSRFFVAEGVRVIGSCVGVVEVIDPEERYEAASPSAAGVVAGRLAVAIGSKDRGVMP
jgi:hypothetical protein